MVQKLITYYNLGLNNLYKVFIYRILIKFNVHRVQYIKSNVSFGQFYKEPKKYFLLGHGKELIQLDEILNGFNPFSGNYIKFKDKSPNWHKNYFNGKESKLKSKEWWKISDFDSHLGDIKCVWELSRFNWVVHLSMLSASGNKESLKLLNSRLNYWLENNIPYNGVNWKCGQEASIRVMHLIASSIILGQLSNANKVLLELIESHIIRIAPTISYAISQNNNHGTSEAAALYIGGNFLKLNGNSKYNHYISLGKKWLENRADVLFSDDGCFSQYSINYHRVALDTYSFCECFRKLNNLAPFSENLSFKLKKAVDWLSLLTDPKNGSAPNIGANDGACLFQFINRNYSDFRSSVQWATLAFNDSLIYGFSDLSKKIYCQFGLNIKNKNLAKKSKPLRIIRGDNDGFFIYRNKGVLLVFRRPIFRFRPSQSDVFHIDLSIDGKNILIDGGTLSYNTDKQKVDYYSGVKSHNTISFDDKDQMPKISRFLHSQWLKESGFSLKKNNSSLEVRSSYHDHRKIVHERFLLISENSLKITDSISGFKKNAKINWRMPDLNWKILRSENSTKLSINFNKKIIEGKCNLKDGYESKLYFRENKIFNIESIAYQPTEFITLFNW